MKNEGNVMTAAIKVKDFADYKARLRKASVIVDARERKLDISEHLDQYGQQHGLLPIEDDGLFDEVAGLVEWPVILVGNIDAAFMDVPPEALISAIKTHQKYPLVRDKAGNLAPRFAIVSNLAAKDGGSPMSAAYLISMAAPLRPSANSNRPNWAIWS